MGRIVASDGVGIAYHTWGRRDRSPVLMIQGLGMDSRGWALQRGAFGRRHRCVAPDNRGTGFSLVPGHPAELGPRRRPPHTLCPTLVTAPGGAPRWVLGTMGADSQPMVLLQLLARLLHAGQDPATAVAAARFVLTGPDAAPFGVWTDPSALRVRVEAGAPEAWTRGLRERGHEVEEIEPYAYVAGHAHGVGVGAPALAGAADPRARTGAASGW